MTIDAVAIARRIELHHADGMAMLATESLRVAGGVAVFREVGSHANKTVAVGLGDVSHRDLDAIDAFFASRGVEPRIELTAFADESLLLELAARGYSLHQVENVLVEAIGRFAPSHRESGIEDTPTVPAGITIERVDPTDETLLRECAMVQMRGFVNPPPPELVAFVMFNAKLAVADTFVARDGSQIVGGATSASFDGVTGLFGASVAASHRRRGIQAALIAARVARGRERGSTLAFIVSKPGIATERNAARLGFEMAYARFALVRRASGLASSPI